MYKNRELFYLNTISDGRLTVLSLLKEMTAIFSTPLYIEVSVEKNYRSKLIGNIEYAGGFPNRSIASNTIKKSAQLFKKKLTVILKSPYYARISSIFLLVLAGRCRQKLTKLIFFYINYYLLN